MGGGTIDTKIWTNTTINQCDYHTKTNAPRSNATMMTQFIVMIMITVTIKIWNKHRVDFGCCSLLCYYYDDCLHVCCRVYLAVIASPSRQTDRDTRSPLTPSRCGASAPLPFEIWMEPKPWKCGPIPAISRCSLLRRKYGQNLEPVSGGRGSHRCHPHGVRKGEGREEGGSTQKGAVVLFCSEDQQGIRSVFLKTFFVFFFLVNILSLLLIWKGR